MYEKDFLKRNIRQVVALLGKEIARLLGLIEAEQFGNAIDDIGNEILNFYGIDTELLKLLSGDTIIKTLTEDEEECDPAALLVLAELLKLEGDAYAGNADRRNASRSYLASLELFLSIAEQTKITEAQIENSHMLQMSQFLKEEGLPEDIQLRMMAFYAADGQFGKAEDELLEMIDAGHPSWAVVQAGMAFYTGLLELSDTELERGELYRDEIEEGLKELRAYTQNG